MGGVDVGGDVGLLDMGLLDVGGINSVGVGSKGIKRDVNKESAKTKGLRIKVENGAE